MDVEAQHTEGVRLDRQGFTQSARDRLAIADADADLDSMAAILLLVRTASEVTNLLEARVHRPAGWSWAGFRVLYALLIAGPLPPQDLARFAGVSRASISSALNTLERDGLVTRSRSAADGRSVVVALTDAGHSRTEAAWVEHHRIERALLAEMSRPDRQRLADLLDGVLAAASALVAVQPAAARPSPASPAPAFPAPA